MILFAPAASSLIGNADACILSLFCPGKRLKRKCYRSRSNERMNW